MIIRIWIIPILQLSLLFISIGYILLNIFLISWASNLFHPSFSVNHFLHILLFLLILIRKLKVLFRIILFFLRIFSFIFSIWWLILIFNQSIIFDHGWHTKLRKHKWLYRRIICVVIFISFILEIGMNLLNIVIVIRVEWVLLKSIYKIVLI